MTKPTPAPERCAGVIAVRLYGPDDIRPCHRRDVTEREEQPDGSVICWCAEHSKRRKEAA